MTKQKTKKTAENASNASNASNDYMQSVLVKDNCETLDKSVLTALVTHNNSALNADNDTEKEVYIETLKSVCKAHKLNLKAYIANAACDCDYSKQARERNKRQSRRAVIYELLTHNVFDVETLAHYLHDCYSFEKCSNDIASHKKAIQSILTECRSSYKSVVVAADSRVCITK